MGDSEAVQLLWQRRERKGKTAQAETVKLSQSDAGQTKRQQRRRKRRTGVDELTARDRIGRGRSHSRRILRDRFSPKAMGHSLTNGHHTQPHKCGQAKEMPNYDDGNNRLGNIGQIDALHAQPANHFIEDGRHQHGNEDARQHPPGRLARPMHDDNQPGHIQRKPEQVNADMYPNHHDTIIIKHLRRANGNWGGNEKVTGGEREWI